MFLIDRPTAGPTQQEDAPASATVIDLAERRGRARREEPPGQSAEEDLEHAVAHWESVFAAAGLDFATPQPASVVVPLVAAELERLVGGLMFVREGGGPRNLPANPDAGIDSLSAMECAALLRELSAVARQGTVHSMEA